MKKVFRFLLSLVLFSTLMLQLNAQTVVTIGNNCMGEDVVPVNVFYNYGYSQSIFSSEELMAGEISSISYKFNSEVPTTISSQIYLGEVSRDVFANAEDFVSADSLTQVYSGNVTFTQGWVTINFTTPFDYSGENNLVVAYMNNTGTMTEPAYFTVCSSVGSKTITCYRGDQEISINNPQEVNSAMRMVLNNRPNVKFEINPFSASCYPPTEILSQQITSQSATFTWNVVEGVEQYAVAYKKSSEVLWDTTFVNTNSITLSQLDVITPYDMKIWSVCSGEESVAFTTSFTTRPNEELVSELPFVCNFDVQAESQLWTILNGTQTNQWHWGNAVNSSLGDVGGGSMYISDDNGVSNSYDGNTFSIVYFSRYIQFNDAAEFKLTFDWKGVAEGNSDYLQVFLLPTTTQLNNNITPALGEITDRLSASNDWRRQEVILSREYANEVYNLVFCWRNDNSVEHEPPIAVDNISLEAVSCGRVTEIYSEINDGENISATLHFVDENTDEEITYFVEYKLSNTDDWVSVQTTADSIILENLLPSSTYSVRVKVFCSETTFSDYSTIYNFTTPCGIIYNFPWAEDFGEDFVLESGHIGNAYAPKCWEIVNGASSNYGWEQSNDYSTDGNGSIYFEGFSTSGTYNDWLITPVIDFNGSQRMTFKIRKSSSNNTIPHFKVYYYDANEEDMTSMSDTSLFQILDTVFYTQNSVEFKKMEVDLSNIGGLARIALVVNERTSAFYLDELTIDNHPLCPDVYGVVATALSSTSMRVDFDTSNSNEYGWVIAYGQADSIQNFNPSQATQVLVNPTDTLPIIINNLTNGIYYLAVKSNCAEGIYSEIETVEIPLAQNLPYFQDFTSIDFNGWNFFSNTTNSWVVGSAVDYNSLGGNAMYIGNGNNYTYNTSMTTTAYATLNISFGEYPAFNLSFDWKAAGETTVDYAKVYILPWDYELSTTLPSESYSLTGKLNQQTQWQTENINLDHRYANGIYKIVFAWKNNASGGTNPPIAIDNISVVPLTCGGVEELTLTNIESNTATIAVSFNDHNTENVQYQIEYKAQSETEWTIAAITDTNYYLIDSLNYQTDYQVRVAVVCSNGELTSYAQEEITTPCGTITQLPWQEQFSTGIGECWYQMLGEMSDTVTHSSTLSQTSNGWKYNIYVGGERIYADLSYEYAKYWIISPSFDLGNGDTTYQLSADVFRTSLNGTGVAPMPNGDKFAILVSTDDGLTWNTANALIFGSGENASYDYNLSAFSPEASRVNFKLANENGEPLIGAIRFAFYGEGSTSRMLVDNIEISQWQPCQTPSMVNVANITANSAELTFLDFGQSQQWEYALQQGSTIDFATAQTQTISYQGTYLNDLLDGMTYSVAVRGLCSEGENSPWSEIITFSTPVQPTSLPFETTFTDIYDNQKWVSISNTNNAWAIGSATFSGEEDNMSAYMSSNGTNYSVDMPVGWNYTYAALYREFDFGAGGDYTLSFDYKVSGSMWGDEIDAGLYVFIKDENDAIIAEYYNTDEAIGVYAGVSQWQRANIELPANIEGIKKIVFWTWGYVSSYSSQSQVPPAIDNVVIEEIICNPPTNLTVSNITENTATLSWEGSTDNYKINYVVEGTEDTLTQITSNTTYTLSLNSFEEYQVNVQSICEEDLYSLPTPTLSFSTLQDADTIPYTCNFETPGNSGWLLRNGSCANQWTIGLPTGGNSNSLFISDNGETAHYSANNNSVVIAEKLFQFTNSEYITITFDLTIGGEISSNIFYDYLKVFLLPANEILEPTTAYDLSGEYSYAMADYAQDVILQHLGTNAICLLEGTQTITITIPTPINEQRKLVFLWRNNNMLGTQPGAIIDNISITTLGGVIEEECLAPTNVEVSQITSNSAHVTWTPQGNETAWQVKLNQGEVIDVTTPLYTLTNLLPETEYDFLVRANCGVGVSEWASVTFTTNDTIIAPIVTTLPATAITQTSAVLNAEITEGSLEILTKGFYYKEAANATWDSIAVEGQTEISVTLSDLLPQTTYAFKAFITTENALIQGEELTFTTDESSLTDVENIIEVNLYPNPAKEKVYLETKGFEKGVKAMLSDLQGRILKEIEINSERIEIDLNTLSSGVYYLKVFDERSTQTIKIIKE